MSVPRPDRLVLVGQAPSKTSGKRPFAASSISCIRLAQLLDVFPCDVHLLLDCRNLLQSWPGYTRGNGHGKPDGARRNGGDHFPWAEACRAAMRLAASVPYGSKVIFAGQKVAECFGLRRLVPLAWYEVDVESAATVIAGMQKVIQVALLPHPSGVNQWYNDTENTQRAASFLRGAVAGNYLGWYAMRKGRGLTETRAAPRVGPAGPGRRGRPAGP